MTLLTCWKLKCTKCTAKHDVSTEDHYNFNVALPVSETSKSLQGLLNGAKTSKILPDYKCNGEDGCNQIGVTREEFGVQEASKYLIVHANRIDHKLDKRGKMRSFKVHTKIDFPKDKLNLSTVFGVGPQSDGTKYEVFGVVEHLGEEYAI